MERSLRVWSDGAFCCSFKEVFLILVRLQPREVGPSLGSVQLRERFQRFKMIIDLTAASSRSVKMNLRRYLYGIMRMTKKGKVRAICLNDLTTQRRARPNA